MALTPEQNDALIREVDDAVRQDDFLTFIKRFGRIVLAAIGLGLLSYGGWLIWTNHKNEQAQSASETFAIMLKAASSARLDDKNYAKLTKEGTEGYKVEAEVLKAALAAGRSDNKAATVIYDGIITNSATPQPFKDLALIRRTALNYDSMKPQDIVAALKSLAVPGNAWFGSAGEMTAMAYLNMGKKREAGDLFAAMNHDKTVAPQIRQRAGQMASSLGIAPDTITDIEEE